jgi:osomolarity two-component system sensor histidine kinase NIK1
MPQDETSAVLARILSTIAQQHDPRPEQSFPSLTTSNGTQQTDPSLPGPDTQEKALLEQELRALISRVQFLEAKAALANTFPITPSEPGIQPQYPNADPREHSKSLGAAPPRRTSAGQRDVRTTWVNNWASEPVASPDRQVPVAQLTEEQLGYIRDHLNKQAEQLKSQREQIDLLSSEIARQQHEQHNAFADGMEDIGSLKRELLKHQQANLAFQKALREIGTIITAVANGDLSKKVLIHAIELDPEITTFKKTTNKMIDQLQEFASQVTRLAREVGTEGRLGGQAVVPDVKGIWAELTNNGTYPMLTIYVHHHAVTLIFLCSQSDGRESDKSSARDCRSHDRSRTW